MNHIYFDYNASTPTAEEAAAAMAPFLSGSYGNPSSSHWAAQEAKTAYAHARMQVAGLLNCRPEEVIFTSGGSEANNHALKGVFHALRNRGNHIITTRIEHPAVIQPCEFLAKIGAIITYVGVDAAGMADPEEIAAAITDKTILISVMHANNEVGTIQPIARIGALAKEHGIVFHTDAAQSAGKISIDLQQLNADLVSLAGHKLYAPKGIGALYVRRGTPLEPIIHGAGHEFGNRAGTENILLAVGLGKACELAQTDRSSEQIQKLRDHLWAGLQDTFGHKVVLNGHPTERLPNTLNVNFIGRTGSEILERIPEIAASTGSACHSGMVQLSPVLSAMGVDPEAGRGAVRFSLGRYTTADEIETALHLIRKALQDH